MNLVERAQKILLQPQQEWHVIEAEPTPPAALYSSYIIPLAAIPPIAMFIGLSLVGYGAGFVSFRIPIITSLVMAIIYYILSLGAVYLLGIIIDALAPSFMSRKDMNQSLKLAAYSSTPLWLAGIFYILPSLWVIPPLIGLYGIYLLFVGLPILMKSPPDKTIPYTAVIALAGIVLYFIVRELTGRILLSMYSPF